MTRYDKISQMKPEQKNHWIDIPELSPWGERIFAEISVADEINAHENGKYEELLEKAVDCLYAAFTAEHALTDTVCRQAEKILLPLSEKAKSMTMHCVAHAHIDMDWMWGFHETVDVALNTFRTMLDMMEEYPAFTFSQSQAALYRIAEYYDPGLFERIQERIREGRWEFAGSTFVELDKNLPNLESMVRHILYTKRYLNQRFGIPYKEIDLDFHPDSFGHSPSVPEILTAGGIRYFYHCRGLDQPHLYRWRSASGAEVLALNEPLWYNDQIRPMYLNMAPKFCYQYGVQDMMKIYGVGDHGGGPTRKDIERILSMQSWPVAPSIRFSTYAAFFRSLEPYREGFPVLTGQLGPTFTGCYSSQSRMKAVNRIGEDRLYEAEMISAYARIAAKGASFQRQYHDAWEKVLFNQFHDILPGSNTPESCYHAMGAFEEAMGAVMAGSAASLRCFADKIDTSQFSTPDDPLSSRSEGGGVGLNTDEKSRYRLSGTERGRGKTRLIHFFNPTRFRRKEVAEAALWDWPGNPACIKAFDDKGNPLLCRVGKHSCVEWNHQRTDILTQVDIPAFGYTTVRIEEGEKQSFQFSAAPPDPRVVRCPENILENDFVRIRFDDGDFSILSCFDKKAGRELLSAPAYFALSLEQHAEGEGVISGGNAWVEGIRTHTGNLHQNSVASLQGQEVETSLRRQITYRLTHDRMTIDVTAQLFDYSPILHLAVCVNEFPLSSKDGVPVLSFRAPLSYSAPTFLCDMQIGTQNRKSQRYHDEFTRNFCFGVPENEKSGLALLSDCKYGCRCPENTLELTLLRASSNPDRYAETGERNCRIGLSPADDSPLALKELGERFAHRDFPYATNTAHKGTLPLTGQLFHVEGDVTVSSVKNSEEGEGIIIRLASVHTDRQAKACITFGIPVTQVFLVDLMEQPVARLELQAQKTEICLLPGQIATLLAEIDSAKEESEQE